MEDVSDMTDVQLYELINNISWIQVVSATLYDSSKNT